MSNRKKAKGFLAGELVRKFDAGSAIVHVAKQLDIHRATVHTWMQKDVRISVWRADQYAVKLGMHPSEIWNDWFQLEEIA